MHSAEGKETRCAGIQQGPGEPTGWVSRSRSVESVAALSVSSGSLQGARHLPEAGRKMTHHGHPHPVMISAETKIWYWWDKVSCRLTDPVHCPRAGWDRGKEGLDWAKHFFLHTGRSLRLLLDCSLHQDDSAPGNRHWGNRSERLHHRVYLGIHKNPL